MAYDARLAKKLCPLLAKLPGATVLPDNAFCIPTVVGPLMVHVYDDWVACRFDGDLLPVYQRLNHERSDDGRLNRCSGKWNWHLWHVHVDGVKADAAGEFPAKLKGRALGVLADIVWMAIEDLTPEAAAVRAALVPA